MTSLARAMASGGPKTTMVPARGSAMTRERPTTMAWGGLRSWAAPSCSLLPPGVVAGRGWVGWFPRHVRLQRSRR
ncbi:MAG: hypothetical protein SNJ84_04050 [Verrucomicrobiia bacterium]